MEIISLVVAALALVVALLARATAIGLKSRIDEGDTDARRRVENLSEDLKAELELSRRLLARVAAGEHLDREMVLEGRLWGEVEPAEGLRLVEAGELRLIDVRTPGEVAGGMIPGAMHIPVDELEGRIDEIPRDGRTTLVYCAGGGRSAAACELLSREGHEGMLNLAGGFSSWTGPSERPGKSSKSGK